MEAEEYITRKGVPELLEEVRGEPKRFNKLEKEVSISSSTLSNRLKEGKQLGILNQVIIESETSSATIGYELSEVGKEYLKIIENKELPELIKKKQELEDKIKDATSSVKKTIAEIDLSQVTVIESEAHQESPIYLED